MPKKCIMILLDGLGDRSYRRLQGQTPLQAASTPALDRLAQGGASGLFHAALTGQALPSENAHFSLFGYDMEAFPGRGALEALGAGIPLKPEEVAVLAHFASVELAGDGRLVLNELKPRVSQEEMQALIQAVGRSSTDDVELRLHHTHGIRCILTLSGQVSPFITDSDPMQEHQPLMAVNPWQEHAQNPMACNAARALDSYLEWTYFKLTDHPVNQARREKGQAPLNCLVTQRAGQLKEAIPFEECYGLKGLSIANGIIYHGLAAYLGLGCRKVEDSSDPGKDLAQRLEMALDELGEHDFIHVHSKAPDEAAHTKDPLHKTRVIESLDQGLAAVLEKLLAEPELLLVVTADHSTPSSGPLIHCGEPVPLLFHGPGIRRDRVEQYDEISAASGALGFVRGKELMLLILNQLDRAKLQGVMDTPVDQPYWPGRREAFRISKPRRD